MTIWKWTVVPTDEQKILVPRGAKFLCCQLQFNMPTLWALVDPATEKVNRTVYTIGTGNYCELPTNAQYLGTYQIQDGRLVFHVFIGEDEL